MGAGKEIKLRRRDITAIWKYSGKEVSEEDIDKAVKAVREACFKRGKEMHSDECSSIHKLAVEMQALKGPKEG